MPQPLGGAGIYLPPPQNYYPSELFNAPQDPSSNVMALNAGDVFCVPSGDYYLDLSPNLILQYLDPVNGYWVVPHTAGLNRIQFVKSDGYNYRVANLTGCPVVAVITDAGSSYVQSSTTVAASGSGGSTWQAIVGGQLAVSTISVAGANYGVPPTVMIPPPPSPGVQATAYASIAGGSVSGVTLNNVGAGYLSVPTAVIVPSPFDPNLSNGITQATVVLSLTGTGSISAVVCTNPGNVVTSAPSLTISGVGSGATATAFLMETVTGASVATAGAGWTGGAALTTVGGIPNATPVITNPLIEGRAFVPRAAQILLAAPVGSSLASVSAIYDGGLFIGTPSAVVSSLAGVIPTASASVTLTMGSAAGLFRLQPAP